MALSIKTEEADRLVRKLTRLTGETITEAVTQSLRERLTRECDARKHNQNMPDQVRQVVNEIKARYNTSPVSQEEWDRASDDMPIDDISQPLQ